LVFLYLERPETLPPMLEGRTFLSTQNLALLPSGWSMPLKARLAGGGRHALAVSSNTYLLSWGHNGAGQLAQADTWTPQTLA
jgi:hypothetical protein